MFKTNPHARHVPRIARGWPRIAKVVQDSPAPCFMLSGGAVITLPLILLSHNSTPDVLSHNSTPDLLSHNSTSDLSSHNSTPLFLCYVLSHSSTHVVLSHTATTDVLLFCCFDWLGHKSTPDLVCLDGFSWKP